MWFTHVCFVGRFLPRNRYRYYLLLNILVDQLPTKIAFLIKQHLLSNTKYRIWRRYGNDQWRTDWFSSGTDVEIPFERDVDSFAIWEWTWVRFTFCYPATTRGLDEVEAEAGNSFDCPRDFKVSGFEFQRDDLTGNNRATGFSFRIWKVNFNYSFIFS